jgi:thioredoxin 1
MFAKSMLMLAMTACFGTCVADAPNNFVVVTDVNKYNQLIKDNASGVVVKFHATWCGACNTMMAIDGRVAGEFEGNALFISVDIDDARDLAKEKSITGVPTYLFIRDGKVLNKQVGTMTEKEFQEKVRLLIGK